jgi:pimeloyl-ACP methyl ester carboxylesterase
MNSVSKESEGIMSQITKGKRIQIAKAMFSGLAFLLLAAAPLSAADTQCFSGSYEVGLHNPLYYVCVPSDWNGDLVVFAHGYVSPIEELVIVDYVIPPDNTPVSSIITGLGYAFATTSYSYNGLVIPQAVEDIKALVDKFPEISGSDAPLHVYLVGASEGGLVTALALEKYPMMSGGLAACGPVGDFRKQIDYFGDFLVLFNYFFPNVLRSLTDFGETPTPEYIPEELLERWPAIQAAVLAAISANPSAAKQLLQVSKASPDPEDPLSMESILGILWYNIFATNDAVEKLGGHPYDNSRRWYSGSRNDLLLNFKIRRFHADSAALSNMEKGFKTSGDLLGPLVTLHTTADPIVPYRHETLYNIKALLAGSLLRHLNIPIVRYGHCQFNQNELLTAFTILNYMAALQ